MKPTLLWLTFFVVLVGALQNGNAGTVLGVEGQKCYSTTFTNFSSSSCLSVYGNWIENIDRATTNANGVTVTILGKYNGAQNNSGAFAGKGKVELNIKTSNATPGTATINLINDPDFGLGGETFTFTISIIPPPTVTSVDVPSPSAPFNNITITLRGTGLQSAKDPASGVIIKNDNLIPFITVGGDANVSSVRVLSSSATSLQAQIFFSAMLQDATVELSLQSDDACVPLGNRNRPLTNFVPFKTRVRVKSTNLKNFVKAITFPFGNTFDQHSIATIHVELLFPAPSSSSFTLIGGTTKGSTTDPVKNSTVFFKLVPATVADTVGNGTPIVTNGFTSIRANPGDNIVPITFRVDDCGGGIPGSTSTVKIQTWMQNTNTNQPPEFVEKTFSVRCKQ